MAAATTAQSHTNAVGLIAQARLGEVHRKPILRWFGNEHHYAADARDPKVGAYYVYENIHAWGEQRGKYTARRNFGYLHSGSMVLCDTCKTLEHALALCRRHQMDMLADPRNSYRIIAEDADNSYTYCEEVDGVGRHLD